MRSVAHTAPITVAFFLAVATGQRLALAVELSVVSVEPPPRSLGTPVDSVITVNFDRPVA